MAEHCFPDNSLCINSIIQMYSIHNKEKEEKSADVGFKLLFMRFNHVADWDVE